MNKLAQLYFATIVLIILNMKSMPSTPVDGTIVDAEKTD